MRPVTSMRDRFSSDERGVVGINLVLFLGFALYAVVQLTRTAVAAQDIDETVDSIVVTTPDIAESLTNVPKLDETNVTAAKIMDAAAPLSGHLDEVIESAEQIDSTVDDINGSASAINGSVKSIGGSVSSILGDVRGIGASVAGIDQVTRSIRQGIIDINHRADVIIGLARAIESDLSNVLAEVGPPGAVHGQPQDKTIAGHANSIDCQTGGTGCER